MNFSTYAQLKAAIADELNRDDLTTQIPGFIRLAEVQTERQLRTRQMLSSSPFTISGEYVNLPAGFLETRGFSLDSNPPSRLDFVTLDTLDGNARLFTGAGRPVQYTIVGEQFRFLPRPDAPYTGRLTYYQAIPALSDAAPTNWLLTKAPDILFYGALINSAPYLKEDARVSVWAQYYQGAIDALNVEDERAQTASNALKTKARMF